MVCGIQITEEEERDPRKIESFIDRLNFRGGIFRGLTAVGSWDYRRGIGLFLFPANGAISY